MGKTSFVTFQFFSEAFLLIFGFLLQSAKGLHVKLWILELDCSEVLGDTSLLFREIMILLVFVIFAGVLASSIYEFLRGADI